MHNESRLADANTNSDKKKLPLELEHLWENKQCKLLSTLALCTVNPFRVPSDCFTYCLSIQQLDVDKVGLNPSVIAAILVSYLSPIICVKPTNWIPIPSV